MAAGGKHGGILALAPLWTVAASLVPFLLEFLAATQATTCKCLSSDPTCWPSPTEWSRFNATIGGHLMRAELAGQPCHAPHYDQARCEKLKDQWIWPDA